MRRIFVWVLFLGAFWGQSQASGQTSREEKIVRTTYAKLRYALKIGAIHDVLVRNSNPVPADLEYKVEAKTMEFDLSNFTSGPVSDISKRIYGDLVTKPNGEDVLSVSVGNYNSLEDLPDKLLVRETNEVGAEAAWSGGQIVTENWNVPFEQFLPLIDKQNNSKYSRYATYHVGVSYDGRSRSYNAMFLFGTGNVPVLVIDTVTNNSALGALMHESLYPAILLESPLSQKPAVANWLKKHQVSDPQCPGGRRQVCCDATTQTCGPAEADVKSALDKPLSRVSRPFKQSARRAVSQPGSPMFMTVSAKSSAARSIGACSDFNVIHHGLIANDAGSQQHTSSNHSWYDAPFGECNYTDAGGGSCDAEATAQSSPTVSETGGVSGNCHVTAMNHINGSASGSSPTANTNGAAAVVTCAGCGCTPTITFAGQSPTFPAGNIWSVQNPYSNTCQAKTLNGSPIIVDTGYGFHLTSQRNGVLFDLAGTGRPAQIAWTDPSYGNAFLALDRDGDGKIGSGKELFGNYTDQPRSDDPNGFTALAVFDKAANGGNDDGLIDEHDRVWSELRLWIDENQDGISQPEELHRLADLGVYSIGLRYVQTRRYDEFGNIFRYKGKINLDSNPRRDNVDRTIYDVFLVTTPQ